MTNKSSQKAGNNAKQLQVETLIIGIDEKRVREIFDEKLATALRDFTIEATDVAKSRSEEFGRKLIDKMVKESALSAFADPAFQILLIDAQKSAASTEREHDYDLLAELMLHRFKKGAKRNVRAGISRAVEIVDQISDEALLGLTIFHAVNFFVPVVGKVNIGLDALESFFSKLPINDLPDKTDWLDHLDILDAIRVSNSGLGGTKSLEDYWYETFDGCVKNGIPAGSAGLIRAKKILSDAGLSQDVLIPNPTAKGYFKLNVINKDFISKRPIILKVEKKESPQTRMPTEREVEYMSEIYDLYDGTVMTKEDFIKRIDEHPSLNLLRKWWNSLGDQSIQITSVGKVLAHANAQRIDNTLPPLE